MVRLIIVTFAFLAWAFYEMSGGADFDPDRARVDSSGADPLKMADAPEAPAAEPRTDIEVTRVSLNLTSVEDVLSGGNDTPAASRLPQQTAVAARTDSAPETVEIIPSLVENANPQIALSDAGTSDDSFAAQRVALDTSADIRVVSGNRVNVRGGPGTSYGVVGTLGRGDRVEVLDDTGTGWVRMRPADGGTMGWIADFLLSDG